MAINWKRSSKEKETKGRGYLLTAGIVFVVMIASLILGGWLYQENFQSSGIFDMADHTYRNDTNYANDVVESFHDLVQDTLYRKGYHFEDGRDAKALYKRVNALSKKKGVYIFQDLNFDKANQIVVKTSKQDTTSVSQFGIDYTLYDLGDRYSSSKADSYNIAGTGLGNVPSGKKETRLCKVMYKDGSIKLRDLMVGDHKFWEKNYTHLTKIAGGIQYAYVDDTADYDDTIYGEDGLVTERVTSDAVPEQVVILNRIERNKKVSLSDPFCYIFTDESGKHTAQANMTYVKSVSQDTPDITEGSNISIQEVYNSVYALADTLPEKTPLLFLSGRNYGGTYFRGNQTYCDLYRERYGSETTYYATLSERRNVYKEGYLNGNLEMHVYKTAEKKQMIPSGLTAGSFAVGLFADQKSSLLNVDSPFFKYETTAFYIRILFNVIPVLFFLQLFLFARYRMVNKGRPKETYLRIGGLLFLPVEIRIVLLLVLLFGVGQSLYACFTAQAQRIWLGGFGTLLLMIVFCSICLAKRDKDSLFRHSIIRRIADTQARRIMRKAQYYQALGMGFYLQRQVLIFTMIEGICLLLLFVVGIFGSYLPVYQLSATIFGIECTLSVWTFIAIAAGVILFVELFSYLRFLRTFITGINGIQHQLDLMGNGDFETQVELPKKFYGFQAEEQFAAIKGGMMHAMEETMRSERMKIELVSNVSHDIKTPLTSIINYVDLLADSKDLPAVEADYVRILKRKSYRLKNMIQDLFDLSKASSGNLPIQFQEIDLSKLVLQTLADMQEEIDKTTLEFKVHVQENVPVYSDGGRLYRVLQNLILNALKYSMENSRVYVDLTKDEGQACFTIKNMSKEELNFTKEQVMERFFRGDASRSTEGSGLGVAIANSFTEVCGGTFDIEINADLFCAKIIMPIYEQENRSASELESSLP